MAQGAQGAQGTAQGAQGAHALRHGLVFPGELTNDKERRRKQQQEMQLALAAQIKEQKARAAERELPSVNPLVNPLGTPRTAEEDAERERKRLQQQELQRALAIQVEEARQRKEEARRRQEAEDAKEEERLRREIAEESRIVKRPEARESRESRRRDLREHDMYRTRDAQGRDFREPGRTMKKSRERVREEDADRGLRKTRDRLREPRARRPRTRDSGVLASPVRDVASPIPSTAYGAADTAGTWVGTCSPSPARRDGEFGFHGFVEQQRQLASEMQRQVAELKSQRDQARQEALKVKEDAMNDRAKHLQELQEVLAEQLRRDEEPKVEVPPPDAEGREVFEHSIVSDSRFVAIDAALTALLSCEAPKLAERSIGPIGLSAMNAQEVEGQVCRLSEAGGSPAWRLTEQLDKDKVAAFRKALDTADGLPSELRQDLCALLEESTPAEKPSDSGHKVRRPPMDPLGHACGIQPDAPPFPQQPLRPSWVRSSTPSKVTPRCILRSGQERRAVSAMSADQRSEAPVRRRSEALASAASAVLAG